MRRAGRIGWILVVLAAVSTVAAEGDRYPLRWLYLQANLADAASTRTAIDVISRAARAGLNGVVLADAKFMTLERYGFDQASSPYHQNVRRLLDVAAASGIEVIPHIAVVSGAHGLLAYDPNLAEGFEVQDAPFEVRGGVATLVADPGLMLLNGGFEQVTEGRFDGWLNQDDPGRATAPDVTVRKSGLQSMRLDPRAASRPGLCRIHQKVPVRPRRCYCVSVWLKTAGLEPTGSFKISVSGLSPKGERPLVFQRFDVEATQEFRQVHAVFNSLDFEEIDVYLGLWGARGGLAWLDDGELVEVGLMNVLRRPGCPLTVRSADGQTTYEERRDFVRVSDPLLGRAQGIPGVYDRFHASPGIRMLNGLPDGTRLKVGFYHPLIDKFTKVDACMTEPKADEILERQVTRLNRLFHSPRRYMLGYNEIRAAGSCRACKATGRTPGQILADHVRRTVAMMERVRPGVELATWHDMFDPSANAVDNYYLVDGTLAGSWEGLPAGMLIVNWTEGEPAPSLRFFRDRGLAQIISLDFDRTSDAGEAVLAAMKAAEPHGAGIRGMMYTTWTGRYAHLEAFGQAVASASRDQ